MNDRPYFPSKPIKLDYIYFHVGRVSVNWANAESSVDSCLSVFAQANPDPLYQAPISTKRRISVFRKQLEKLRIDGAVKQGGRDLIDQFEHLAWYRHWTTHGTVELASIQGETWRKCRGMVAFLRENLSTRELEIHEMHLKDIEDLGDEALRLYYSLVHWLAIDLGCSTPKKTEKVCRKIGVGLPRPLPVSQSAD